MSGDITTLQDVWTTMKRDFSESAALTVDQAAHHLGVSSATIWRLLRDGQIARVKIGRRTFVRRVDADSFLADCVQRAA